MNLDDITQGWLDEANEAIERLKVIRDAFLDGRDADAVRLLRDVGSEAECFVTANDSIPAGAVRTMHARPQRPFRARRFALSGISRDPSSLLEDVEVLSIRFGTSIVGHLSPQPALGTFFGVDLAMFEATRAPSGMYEISFPPDQRIDRFGVGLHGPWVMPGMDISIDVRNAGELPAQLCAMLLGVTRELL